MRIRCSSAALTLGAIVCVAGPAVLLANDIDYTTARLDKRLPAVRALGNISVDGFLDETDWVTAPVAKGFIQNEPREGEAASEDTEVRVLYDATYLYVGVFARDREPNRIITSELAKDFDRSRGDTFEIVLDTFRDERNGYWFATNAQGAKWDAQMVNEGRELNENWDAIWHVRTRVVEDGWYAEIAIPFRTLRFGGLDTQIWGVNFQRRIRRHNEDSFWSPLPRIYQLSRVSMAGTLEGLQGVRPGNDLRVKPYVLGSTGTSRLTDVDNDFDVGLDVKYGVTSGLTWDFTVNTDFSQVEADEQQVNLTRFSLFFPEKRDFFLENSGVFQFGQGNERGGGAAGGGGGGGAQGGRPNQVRDDAILFFSRRIGLSDAGGVIPILGGTRLTGRAGGFTLGALNIQQRDTIVSPSTNFTALRLRRDVLANSDIGVMVLNKETEGSHYNRLVGADANFRFFRNLNINTFAAKTFSPETSLPGEDADTIARAGFNYRGDFWEFRSSYLNIGERFNDEMGFVPRVGITKFNAYMATHFRPKRFSKWLREFWPHIDYQDVSRNSGSLDSRYVDYHFPFTFQDGSSTEPGLNPTIENLIEPFVINRRRGVVIQPGRYEFNELFVVYRGNASKPVSFNTRVGVGDFYDGYKQSYAVGGTLRLGDRFNGTFNFSRNQISLSGGSYNTNLISSRVDYSFSTMAFLSALLQYNTDAQEWSSNMRFNIIHRPLSDFFLVYNERRDTLDNSLLDRALVAKMTYMMAF